jgi:hypothetical protein
MGTRIVTKQPDEHLIHPHGHSKRRGRALHRHRRHRVRPIAHDLDVLLGEAKRGHPYDLSDPRRVHQHGRTLRDPEHHGGHSNAPVRRGRRR